MRKLSSGAQPVVGTAMIRSKMVLETVAFGFAAGVVELAVGQDDGSRLCDCDGAFSLRARSDIVLPIRLPMIPATIAMRRPYSKGKNHLFIGSRATGF